jgi:hypothetical protein
MAHSLQKRSAVSETKEWAMQTTTKILIGLAVLALPAGLLMACGAMEDTRCDEIKAKVNGCDPGAISDQDACNLSALDHYEQIMDMSCEQLGDHGKTDEWKWPWQSCEDLGKCWEQKDFMTCRPSSSLTVRERRECGEYLGRDFIDSDKLYHPDLYDDDPTDPNGADCSRGLGVKTCDQYPGLICKYIENEHGEFYRCRLPDGYTAPTPDKDGDDVEPANNGSGVCAGKSGERLPSGTCLPGFTACDDAAGDPIEGTECKEVFGSLQCLCK